MKTAINSPASSKINWLAMIIALINIAAIAGFIPQAYVIHILSIVNIAGPALIMVARTWFTDHQWMNRSSNVARGIGILLFIGVLLGVIKFGVGKWPF